MHPVSTVCLMNSVLNSGRAVSQRTSIKKANNRLVTGILICQNDRKSAPDTICQLAQRLVIPHDERTLADTALHVLSSKIIVVLDVKHKTHTIVQPFRGQTLLTTWALEINLPHLSWHPQEQSSQMVMICYRCSRVIDLWREPTHLPIHSISATSIVPSHPMGSRNR